MDLEVDGQQLFMEVDTGASLSLVSETIFRRLWPSRPLQPTTVQLKDDFEARQEVLTDLWGLQDDGKPSIEVGCLPDTQGGGPVCQTVERKAFQQAKLFLEHFTVTM